jgi:phosphonate transport system substrate-binding protein
MFKNWNRAKTVPLLSAISLLLAVGISISIAACNSKEQVPGRESVSTAAPAQGDAPLRIGMGAMITPREGYVYYQRLREYIEKKLGHQILLVDRGNYDEMNSLLKTGGVDAAFVCAGPYVEGKKQFGMELLAMPLVKGKPIYYSYIIVPKSSPARRLEDLRGKVFAFADPKSNSGKLVPTYMLSRINETPERFFARYVYTYGHDTSIRAVAENVVDGAAVDSLIWDYTARKMPELTEKTRIIARSEPYGIPPIVVRPGLDHKLKQQLKDVLISASADKDGKEILNGMMIDGFVSGDDANYDTIRAVNKWLAGRKKQNN